MAWVAVDEPNDETIFERKPERNGWYWDCHDDCFVTLPQGTIKKLIGRELTWNDEPVELE